MLCCQMLWNKNYPLNFMVYTGLCGRSFTETCFGETAAGTGRLVLIGDNPKPDPELPGPQAGMKVHLPTTHTKPTVKMRQGRFRDDLMIPARVKHLWRDLEMSTSSPQPTWQRWGYRHRRMSEYPQIRNTGGWKWIWWLFFFNKLALQT